MTRRTDEPPTTTLTRPGKRASPGVADPWASLDVGTSDPTRPGRGRLREDLEAPEPGVGLVRERQGMQKTLFAVLTTLAVLTIGEGLAWAFFALAGASFHLPDPARHVATDAQIAKARRSYDHDLGWQVPYDTAAGERPRRHDFGRPLISVYGDSFVHGDEVTHGETWAEALAGSLSADVFNFGSSAYGMDQALLRFERDFARRPTEIVVFGFISYDVERNVSVYWKFLHPEADFALTKPRFRLQDGGLALLPNPVQSPDELSRLRDPDFIRELGVEDFWFDRNRLGEARFPRFGLFLRRGFWDVALRFGRSVDAWTLEEPRAVAEAILTRFHRGCRQRGARPLIVHLPVVWELVAFTEHGELPPSLEVFDALCRREKLRCLTLLEELGGRPTADIGRLFTAGVEGGHYNAAGNREVGGLVGREIRSLLRTDAARGREIGASP